MRRTVQVEISGTFVVDMEIDVEDGDDPTSLTPQEERRACSLAFMAEAKDMDVVGVSLVE